MGARESNFLFQFIRTEKIALVAKYHTFLKKVFTTETQNSQNFTEKFSVFLSVLRASVVSFCCICIVVYNFLKLSNLFMFAR